MHIHHIAIWVSNLNTVAQFYVKYFGASHSSVYTNEKKQFSSVFVYFEQGAALELMHKPGYAHASMPLAYGYTHIAISVGNAGKVDALTQKIASDGFEVLSLPRKTGDGYYESVVCDPDGNMVEITV